MPVMIAWPSIMYCRSSIELSWSHIKDIDSNETSPVETRDSLLFVVSNQGWPTCELSPPLLGDLKFPAKFPPWKCDMPMPLSANRTLSPGRNTCWSFPINLSGICVNFKNSESFCKLPVARARRNTRRLEHLPLCFQCLIVTIDTDVYIVKLRKA